MCKVAESVGQALLDALLPGSCLLCGGSPSDRICPACAEQLPTTEHPCQFCGAAKQHSDSACASCGDAGWPHVATVSSACDYTDPLPQLVQQAKAGHDRVALLACCDIFLMQLTLPRLPVVAIPPTPGRRPGQHLATALAQAVARESGQPYLDGALHQKRRPAAQHDLSERDRERNVEDLYACTVLAPPACLLIDDLITTGATIRSAARCLRQAGCRIIHVACLARAP
jgi:predicted amidophosphoribosyltransferase